MPIIVYIDGLCEPINPGGIATWGFVIYKDGEKLFDGRGVVGDGTGMSNNLAEYTALFKALKELIKHGWQNEEVVIRSDSRLLINQMTGWWEVHGGLYYPAYAEAVRLASLFKKISFAWIPREKNQEADALSRRAYEAYCMEKGIEPKYHEERQASKETCMNCKWVGFSGMHIGCYRDGEWQRWIPKSFAKYNKCSSYSPK